MTEAFWNIGLVLIASLAAAFCFVLALMKQLSKTGTRERVIASYAFGVGSLLLAITGLITVGPWLAILAACFFIVGAWRLQRDKETSSIP